MGGERRADWRRPVTRLFGCLIAVVATAVGCGESSNGPAAKAKALPAKPSLAQSPETAAAEVQPVEKPTETPAVETPNVDQDEHARPPVAASTAALAAASVPAVRIALLTDGGPTLIDLEIELDGRPLGASFDEILQHVRTSADADQDGQVTWLELANQRQMRGGLLGHPALNDARARLEFIRQHDANENGVVDEQEWSVVFRQQSSRGRPFGVESRDDHRDWNRLHSPLLAILDSDGDRVLSVEECRGASERLMKLDADDDERIQLFEVSASQVEIPGMPARAQRRSSGPYFLWQIGRRTDWSQLIRACQIQYAQGEPLATGCFPARARLFAQLDADANGRLSLKEIAALAEVEPQMRLAIRWGGDGNSRDSPATSVRTWSDELGERSVNCLETATGVVLTQGASRVALFDVNQAGPSPNARAAALLAQYDGDKNAYLDGQEIEMASAAFGVSGDEVDANRDGQIKLEEIESFLLLQANATAEQVRAVASHPEDALWVHLDANADGRLSGDEIAKSGQRLLELDRDDSKSVSVDELPEAVWIAVARGDAPMGLVRPTTRRGPMANGQPAWFLQMDSNSDGRLSRREFLGDDSLFQQLDADRDGQLDAGELSPKP